MEELHQRRLPGIQVGAEEPPRDRVERVPDLGVISGPTLAADQVASTNDSAGNAASALASQTSNTDNGAAPPSGRYDRRPATSRHHVAAAACISGGEVTSHPRQNESRI
ncbi:hypothetical protein [Amycolatopsis pigmentata]|uniref:Uncharacterized protein n=1 Tax=Amycolatopsis pigmentata TaxID=450801 RepID=A0ABW5FLP2_9PSEU